MDVLLMIALLFAGVAVGAPPVDLSDFEGKNSAEAREKKKNPQISEREMIYLDNQDGVSSTDPSFRVVRYKVAGRDRPGRDGKILLRLNENQRVKFIRESKDKRWTMVLIVASQRRVWIPSAAIFQESSASEP